MIAHLDAAHAELSARRAGGAVVRAGTFPSAGASILPRTLRRLRDARAAIHVEVHEEGDDRELLRLVTAARLDVAFVVLPVDDDAFETVELLEDPWYVAVPAGSALARDTTPLSLRSVAGLPLIGFRAGSPLQLGESRLRMAGYGVDVVCRVDDVGTIQGLVAAGLGVAVLPGLLLVQRHPGVVVRTFAEPCAPRRVGLAWSAIGPPGEAVRTFVDATVAAVRQPDAGARPAIGGWRLGARVARQDPSRAHAPGADHGVADVHRALVDRQLGLDRVGEAVHRHAAREAATAEGQIDDGAGQATVRGCGRRQDAHRLRTDDDPHRSRCRRPVRPPRRSRRRRCEPTRRPPGAPA